MCRVGYGVPFISKTPQILQISAMQIAESGIRGISRRGASLSILHLTRGNTATL